MPRLTRRLHEEIAFFRQEPARRAALRAALIRPYRTRQFGAFGAHSIIDRPAWLYGTWKIAVGANVMVMAGAWLSAEKPSWDRSGPAISIGDGCAFRAWLTLSASAGIVIGRDVVFGAGCSVVDSDHTWREGQRSVLHNPVQAAPIRIGDGTWLGDHVVVLRGTTIGERCAIGAGSVVRGEMPDGSVAAGVPARIIGRTDEL